MAIRGVLGELRVRAQLAPEVNFGEEAGGSL